MSDDAEHPDPELASCESEQLHLSGQIQPHGALLRIGTDGVVTHASSNSAAFLGIAPDALLGRGLPAELTLDGWDDLARCATSSKQAVQVNACVGPGGRLDLALSPSGDGWLLEFEPAGDRAAPSSPRLFEAMRQIRTPTGPDQPDDAFRHLCEIVAEMTGFGRVLLYRFAADWSGEVVAETLAGPMQSYLGLHFPAADIPAIARNLYVLTRQRFILDSQAAPVPIVALDPESGPPDQTYGDLRSVSPAHRVYMANMGVRSSCSVSIMIRGKLWGLITCHNAAPKPIGLATRERLVKTAREFAVGLLSHTAGQHLKFIDGIEREVRDLLVAAAADTDLAVGLNRYLTRLLALVDADSAAVAIGGTISRLGDAPEPEQIALIDSWFAGQNNTGFASTDHLAAQCPGAEAFADQASGVIAIRVSQARWEGACLRLFWFRREWPRLVNWAGDPAKPGGGDGPLTPRQSFETWTEMARQRSRPWTLPDLLAAKTLRASLFRSETAKRGEEV